jgi:hypothetical protein
MTRLLSQVALPVSLALRDISRNLERILNSV